MKEITMTGESALQSTYQIWKKYRNTDMAECDYFAGETVDDLNTLDMLVDSCIPVMLKSKVITRRTALYKDSKPLLHTDIGDDVSMGDDLFNDLNRIIHHDLPLIFRKKRIGIFSGNHKNITLDKLQDSVQKAFGGEYKVDMSFAGRMQTRRSRNGNLYQHVFATIATLSDKQSKGIEGEKVCVAVSEAKPNTMSVKDIKLNSAERPKIKVETRELIKIMRQYAHTPLSERQRPDDDKYDLKQMNRIWHRRMFTSGKLWKPVK